jgi:signal transduction histidine kinase/CheY-like chemotaxis protein/streptogramin lyase
LLCLALPPLPAASPGRYSFRVYEHPEGLEDLVIRDLLQDREGFLWVATHTGLYRFDGRQFRRFTTEDGLPDNWVTNLALDSRGTLWASTRRGLSRLRNGSFERVVADRPWLRFRPNRGTPLAADRSGNLYFGATDGLFAVRADIRPGDPPVRPPLVVEKLADLSSVRSGIGALWIDDEGWLWHTDARQKLMRRELATGRTEPVDPSLPDTVWLSVLPDQSGAVWIAGSAGELFVREKGSARFRQTPVEYAGQGRMAALRTGGVVVPAASGFTIVKLRPGGGEHPVVEQSAVNASTGLPGEVVECFFEDRDGILWIGTVGTGLLRWSGGVAWRSWTLQDGMPGEFITQVQQAPDGSTWVGTLRGLLRYRRESGGLQSVRLPAAWGDNPPVFALAAAPDGRVWLSTARGSLRVWDPHTGRGITFGEAEGFEFGELCHILIHEGTVWVADVFGLSVLRESPAGLRQERLWPPDGETATVYRTVLAPDGTLWAATARGLLRFRQGRLRLFTKADGLQADDVFGLALAPDGALWLHYRLPLGVTRAVLTADQFRTQHFREADGLASDKVFSIAADEKKRIWVGTESGLSVYAGASPWTTFNRDHGLVWNDCNFGAISVDSRGAVWVGTSKGLSRFLPPSRVERSPPPVTIHELRLSGKRLPPDTWAVPLRSNAEFTIAFAALRFANQSSLRFRYRLDSSPTWTETRDREVNFATLSSGLHRFEVTASEGNGNWSAQPAVVSFRVPTPWWQQWWALALALWLLLALIRLFWRWRYHRMIRRQKQLEMAVGERTRELEVQRERAEAASKFKDQILANVSHEIRTPLNGIVGFTSLMLESNLDEEQREQLRTVHASGKSLVDIIEDLLDFASIEAGDLQLQVHAIGLAEVVDQTMRTLRYEADRRGLLFYSHLADDLPPVVRTDDHRLRQVLLNLTGNAIKFTEQGSVAIRVSRLPAPPEWASAPAASSSAASGRIEWILFEVADTGIGISPQHQQQIFEPFRQLDGSSRRVHGGTGLGLATVRKIVDCMGGAITLESELGHGSTFRVALPLAIPDAPDLHQEPAHPETDLHPTDAAVSPEAAPIRRVLIAEDNPVNQKLLDRILAKKGLEVVAVADGKEALEATQRERFDLILMDIQMPVMDGIAATRAIREREQSLGLHRVPIIAVTANGMFQCREECFSVGMDGYVVKPFGPANLFAAIDTVQRKANGSLGNGASAGSSVASAGSRPPATEPTHPAAP